MISLGTDAQDLTPEEAKEVLRLANILYFRSRAYTQTTWRGVQALKCPMDLWVYQELICKLKIDLLVETGTAAGGTALFFADLFDRLGHGNVLSIDIQARDSRPIHPRITYLTGSSLSRGVLDGVKQQAAAATAVMVILDSDHKAPFKLLELAAYAPFVTLGSYLIAEDTAFDHYPAFPEYGPGPAKAVSAFVAGRPEFVTNLSLEKHLITFAPMAFLERIKAD